MNTEQESSSYSIIPISVAARCGKVVRCSETVTVLQKNGGKKINTLDTNNLQYLT
jgi:hypothetical protein